jgi:putative salt-induced outer membrane protein YdiY
MRTKFILPITLTILLPIRALCEDQPSTNAPPKWVGSVAAGLMIATGNTDTSLATLTADATKKWESDELNLGASGAYGKTQNANTTVTSTETARGFFQYNRLFTERFYGYARLEALHDGVALIRYRATLGPGVGYYLIKNKRSDLSLEAGPSYIWENVNSVTRDYLSLRVAEKFHYQLSDRARIWQSVEWLPEAMYIKNYIINAELGIEADLRADKKLSLKSYIQDTYDNVVDPGLKHNNLKWVTAVAYKF